MGISIIIIIIIFFLNLPFPSSSIDPFSLVYKGCANQTFTSAAAGVQAISALSSALLAQSAASTFYKTTTTSSIASHQPILGLYQCRGDLTNADCAACLHHLLPLWSSLCPASALAARVHLIACYALYQVSGFPQVSGTQMLYKTCGRDGGGSGFEEKRGTAFANLENGMTTNRGFYATGYQSVYAMAQCEGDLSSADCTECVSEAVQKAEAERGGASSGQVYLDKCYITYNYYPNGVPRGGGGGGGGGLEVGGAHTGKTVAIVVGAAAGVGFLIICLRFARNLMKKSDDY